MFCEAVAKDLTAFCPCLENSCEAELKNNGLISLSKKSLEMVYHEACRIIVTGCSQFYNEKERVQQREKDGQFGDEE